MPRRLDTIPSARVTLGGQTPPSDLAPCSPVEYNCVTFAVSQVFFLLFKGIRKERKAGTAAARSGSSGSTEGRD
ncbi:unnamed protein product [Sympodiomycopsis kandeliae]